MAQKRLKGRIFSDQPNKYVLNIQPNKFLLKRLMFNGKKRLKGRIFYVKPNKYMRERPMLKGKKWRLKEEEDKEDMMCKLPDEILVSIMLLLTMKEGARMSLVSRRWQKIWNTTIPVMPRLTFNVDGTRYPTYQKINALNNKVVKIHEAPTLDEFLLIASSLFSKHWHHINTWMDFAVKKHVKKLTLNLSPLMDYDATFVADNFHSLRELVMEGIDVTENFIHRLFSNSPFLERFSLSQSNRLHKLNIASAPNLKYLKLSSCHTLRHLEITSVQNLNTLEITNFVTLESLSISVPNLPHLLLGIHDRVFQFGSNLTLLGQIKRLTLVIEAFGDVMWDQNFQFPRFSAVEHLEVKMASGFKIPIHRLPDLLKAAPLLNTLSFQDYKLGHPAEDSGLKWLEKHIPSKVEVNQNSSCQYLKVVKLDIFAGCQYEVEFLLHLLKYTVSVEKIIIQLMPSTVWRRRKSWWCNEDQFKFDNQYELLCLGCAQLLKTRICQMHPCAELIII